jgi:hypothetical protein
MSFYDTLEDNTETNSRKIQGGSYSAQEMKESLERVRDCHAESKDSQSDATATAKDLYTAKDLMDVAKVPCKAKRLVVSS